MLWYESQPELLDDIADGIKASGQNLVLKRLGHRYAVVGTIEVRLHEQAIDQFNVKIVFPDDYPKSIPEVYETSNKIERTADRHLNSPKWHACLFVSHARWETWPIGASFSALLKGPIYNFFVYQLYFNEFGIWPHGHYSHREDGIIEYYEDKFCTKQHWTLYKLLKLTIESSYARQMLCPCGKKEKIRRCHGKMVELLKKNILKIDLEFALSILCKRLIDQHEKQKLSQPHSLPP